MKKLLVILVLILGVLPFTNSAEAHTVRVRGYYKKTTGTYVAPHYKTSPNRSKLDNYSTKGNYNPYTGKSGKANPYKY